MNGTQICPNCGKEIDNAEMRFCPFCGTALVMAAPLPAETPVDAVRARYEAYMSWVDSTLAQQEFGRVLSALFTGNRAFKNSPEHEQFLVDLQTMSDDLTADYQAGKQRETLPALLQYVLIDCHRDTPNETDWMFLAAEKMFMPLLELLTQGEAAALFAPYKLLRKKQPGLEIQKNIKKKLKALAEL